MDNFPDQYAVVCSRQCNPAKCPVWTEWTEWTPCTATCGGGTRYKLRDCVLPPTRGGALQCTGDDKVSGKF